MKYIVLIIITTLFGSLLLVAFMTFGFFGPNINQDVKGESDGNFEVRTFVWYHGDIIRSHYTWKDLGYGKGLPVDKIDSAKKANYSQAHEWVEQFKKIR